MAKLNKFYSHHLSPKEALECAKKILSDLKAEYGDKISNFQENWSNNKVSFSFKAMSLLPISGSIEITSTQIKIQVKAPLLVKNDIEDNLDQRIPKLLA